MAYDFGYLIDKVRAAPMRDDPFRHLYIPDFFSDEHFRAIVAAPEIDLPAAGNDDELFDRLFDANYRAVEFPGCTASKDEYLKWRKGGKGARYHTACEGFGMTLRLTDPQSPILNELDKFLASDPFNAAMAERFGVDLADCVVDGGIQKYLDGYEISPHPDIRRKAATFMININPGTGSEQRNHHTHYMKFRPDREYIRHFWEGNEGFDRCWVPWDWCETAYQQTSNNSLVMFSPANDTLHAVKAHYNHLTSQRTQLYGNLWYRNTPKLRGARWEKIDLTQTHALPLRDRVKALLPQEFVQNIVNYKRDRRGRNKQQNAGRRHEAK